MRVAARQWGVNTEVCLVVDEPWGPVEKDKFWTEGNPELPDEIESIEAFWRLEDSLPPPRIGGELAALHPYWHERAAVRNRQAVHHPDTMLE